MSSLPFAIGDIVEINEDCISDAPTLADLVGQRGRVETMGISWVKITIGEKPRRLIISADKLRRVEDEDTHRF